MENQPITTKKIMVNYGVMLGVILVIISVTIYALGMQYNQDWKTGSLGWIAIAAIIFLGIKKFREFNGGNLSIGEALKTGIGIALIGGLISIFYSFIFMNYIEPDFLANTMAKAEIEMIEKYPQLTDEQIEQQIGIMKKISTPAITSAIALVASLFLGFIFALISGFILKNNSNK